MGLSTRGRSTFFSAVKGGGGGTSGALGLWLGAVPLFLRLAAFPPGFTAVFCLRVTNIFRCKQVSCRQPQLLVNSSRLLTRDQPQEYLSF